MNIGKGVITLYPARMSFAVFVFKMINVPYIFLCANISCNCLYTPSHISYDKVDVFICASISLFVSIKVYESVHLGAYKLHTCSISFLHRSKYTCLVLTIRYEYMYELSKYAGHLINYVILSNAP